jgi:hypothetical protein
VLHRSSWFFQAKITLRQVLNFPESQTLRFGYSSRQGAKNAKTGIVSSFAAFAALPR